MTDPKAKRALATVDIDGAAGFLGCCRATVRREYHRGNLRGFKVGQRFRFNIEDLQAYLERDDPTRAAERAAWDARVRAIADAAPALTPEQITALHVLFDRPPNGP
ncbi:helix-turn-helix domain-containing protein [Mycobacterium scrofulaceum]|uniref:Helix-turn-helix domain-containing protein n=1 Tax=Mycobacterium scrofulaceum TaxID=1783 RepID=A0A1A2W2D9_MYCSC|nr:helix-turn-helix domain-containing protein [Mycobacterium scrofulaceum]OBI07066.1 hypothetical protein A5679_11530 [Mycobacterium scrofulaceum]